MRTLMGIEDVVKDSCYEEYKDKIVVLKPEYLKPEYREAKNQLFVAQGGFGCDPGKMGTAVYGYFCIDGEITRVERFDIIGIATDEAVKSWERLFDKKALKNEDELK